VKARLNHLALRKKKSVGQQRKHTLQASAEQDPYTKERRLPGPFVQRHLASMQGTRPPGSDIRPKQIAIIDHKITVFPPGMILPKKSAKNPQNSVKTAFFVRLLQIHPIFLSEKEKKTGNISGNGRSLRAKIPYNLVRMPSGLSCEQRWQML
jgi:hypothetical protein